MVNSNKCITKFLLMILCVNLIFVCLCGCGNGENINNGKLKIITTLFPQYDFVKQICGDEGDVTLLLSPGTDSHSFDPTPKDISNILSCDIFIYTGDEMEPWVSTVLKSVGKDVAVIDLSKCVTLMGNDHDHSEENKKIDHHHTSDPHYWLNMENAIKMVDEISKALQNANPEKADLFAERARPLKTRLEKMDKEFRNAISNSEKTIVFGGRFAYYYFVNTYSLKYKTVYDTCSVNVEPSAKTVTDMVKFVKDNGIKYIYHEELSNPKTARSIAESTGAELLEFSTAHNISKDDFDKCVTFIDIMEKNLENLKKGLN